MSQCKRIFGRYFRTDLGSSADAALLLIAVALVITLSTVLFAASPRVDTQQSDVRPKKTASVSGGPPLPPGPLQQKARTACLECHDAHIIVQQRLDKKTWTKEVDKMIRWGAVVDPKDRDAFIEYFSATFGTDAAAPTTTSH
jgi:hypothetical protein